MKKNSVGAVIVMTAVAAVTSLILKFTWYDHLEGRETMRAVRAA